jgi:hypothetical protein
VYGLLLLHLEMFMLTDTDIDCAHSAFIDHTVSPGTPKRESIEVRAIVIG